MTKQRSSKSSALSAKSRNSTRGGTTRGANVTLATEPSDAWRALQEPGLSAYERDRRAILGELLKDFTALAEPWAEAARQAEGIPAGSPTAGEEWVAGPYMIVRNLRLLDQALAEIERYGQPQIPGPVTTRPDGQVTAQVFPQSIYDRIFYSGVSAEVWMEPGVSAAGLADTQAVAYKDPEPRGEVCLVLGAGNVGWNSAWIAAGMEASMMMSLGTCRLVIPLRESTMASAG